MPRETFKIPAKDQPKWWLKILGRKTKYYTFKVNKISARQEIEFFKLTDEFLIHANFKGKGLARNLAETLEKLPQLMQVIFAGQKGLDKVDWLQIPSDDLIEMKKAFEKKNPITMRSLKDSFLSSDLVGLDGLTKSLKNIGQMFTATLQETAAP